MSIKNLNTTVAYWNSFKAMDQFKKILSVLLFILLYIQVMGQITVFGNGV